MQRAGIGVVGILLFVVASHHGVSQGLEVDKKQIEPLIREWNYANNARSRESFANVYAGLLIFYTQTLPEARAIAFKQKMFNLKPDFRQRIKADLVYVPYTSGVIKVDFTKEVFEGSGWKSYASYLLVTYEGGRYQIVGEGDYATDRTLRYDLRLGEPMESGTLSGNREGVVSDSSMTASPVTGASILNSVEEFLKTGDWSAIVPLAGSMGVITIPKAHVFILIGLLSVGGIMIFIADSVHSAKRRKRVLVHKEVFSQGGVSAHYGGSQRNGTPSGHVGTSLHNGHSMQKRSAGDNVIMAFRMQSVFEDFVVTLFDPLLFSYRRAKASRVHAGSDLEREGAPDLEFEFNHKGTHVKFAVKCLYYKNRVSRELQLFSAERQRALKDFEQDRKMDVYYVLGIGGTPDDPKELYLVPLKSIHGEFVRKEALRPYWKSGMFFYNRSACRLQ